MVGTACRWLLFAGLLGAVGALTLRTVFLPQSAPSDRDEGRANEYAAACARFGATALLLVTVGCVGRLASELAVFRDPFEPVGSELSLLVNGTSWGRVWLLQVAATVITLAGFVLARRGQRRRLGWMVALVGTALLAFTPSLGGHAVAAGHFVTAAVTADLFHVVCGGTWLGTLGAMWGVVRLEKRRGRPVPKTQVVQWLTRFTRLALGSAAVLVVTGLFAAWLHLGSVSGLWTDPYGQRLSIKLLLVLGIALCGRYNWKWARTIVAEGEGSARLPKTARLELALGLAVLLVTAVLVVTPPPAH